MVQQLEIYSKTPFLQHFSRIFFGSEMGQTWVFSLFSFLPDPKPFSPEPTTVTPSIHSLQGAYVAVATQLPMLVRSNVCILRNKAVAGDYRCS